MRDKLLQIRVDESFISKIAYLQRINGFKSIAETVRKIVEKEYEKENILKTKATIIRCKDCKHYTAECGNEQFALGYCPFLQSHLVMSEGFCAWAEKETQNGRS